MKLRRDCGSRLLHDVCSKFAMQALDKSCPERNGNEPSAYQRGEGQDYYCRRDGGSCLRRLLRRGRRPPELIIVTASRVFLLKRNCRSKSQIPGWVEAAARTVAGLHSG